MRNIIQQEILIHPHYQCQPEWGDADQLVKTLASSVAHHDVLVLGEQMVGVVPDFLDGLNITSQLIHAVENAELHSQIKTLYKSDIRLTAHCQPYPEFLTDIQAHRFDMIVASIDKQYIPQVLSLLMDNALLCYFSPLKLQHSIVDSNLWNCALLSDNHIALINRSKVKPSRRRKK